MDKLHDGICEVRLDFVLAHVIIALSRDQPAKSQRRRMKFFYFDVRFSLFQADIFGEQPRAGRIDPQAFRSIFGAEKEAEAAKEWVKHYSTTTAF